MELGFNPCFGGFCSKTRYWSQSGIVKGRVSILVLVDFALKRTRVCIGKRNTRKVSILVLVDFALKQYFCLHPTELCLLFQSLFWWILL